jgi:hypothetical protein
MGDGFDLERLRRALARLGPPTPRVHSPDVFVWPVLHGWRIEFGGELLGSVTAVGAAWRWDDGRGGFGIRRERAEAIHVLLERRDKRGR